jgi:hypothetical protein
MKIFENELGIKYNSFIYKWTDKKFSKYYIGSHVGSINDGYLFGGIDIKKEFNSRPSDFYREILSYHIISEYYEIRNIEKEYLQRYDVENNNDFYNRTNESYGGHHKQSVQKRLNDIDENGLNHFQRASIKMVQTRKNKNSYKTSKIKEYESKKSKMKEISNKISETLKGSKWVNKDGMSKYIKPEEYDEYISNGWVNGIKKSISYDECKKIAIENNIDSAKKWFEFSKKINAPYHPERKYKEEWISWNSFLNK